MSSKAFDQAMPRIGWCVAFVMAIVGVFTSEYPSKLMFMVLVGVLPILLRILSKVDPLDDGCPEFTSPVEALRVLAGKDRRSD